MVICLVVYIGIYNGQRIPLARREGKILLLDKLTFDQALIFLICLFLAILCATRPVNTTYDTGVYVEWFNSIKGTPLWNQSGRFRPAFEFFSRLFLWIFRGNSTAVFSCYVLLNCLVVSKAINNFDLEYGNGISFIIYVCFLGLYYNYIVIRAGIALSFVILGLSYIDKNKLKMTISFIIAILFHETALIVFVCLFLVKLFLKIRKERLYILLGVSVILYFTKITDLLFNSLLNMLYPHLPSRWFHTYILYISAESVTHSLSLYYVACFIITAICIFRMDGRDNLYKTFLAINIEGQFIFSLYSGNTIMGRIWDYMVPATYLYLLPKAFDERSNSKIFCLICSAMALLVATRIIITRLPFYM